MFTSVTIWSENESEFDVFCSALQESRLCWQKLFASQIYLKINKKTLYKYHSFLILTKFYGLFLDRLLQWKPFLTFFWNCSASVIVSLLVTHCCCVCLYFPAPNQKLRTAVFTSQRENMFWRAMHINIWCSFKQNKKAVILLVCSHLWQSEAKMNQNFTSFPQHCRKAVCVGRNWVQVGYIRK